MSLRKLILWLSACLLLCCVVTVYPSGELLTTSVAYPGDDDDDDDDDDDELSVATIRVDCDDGDSINEALEKKPGSRLTVLIDGVCTENVVITRSNVILAGANPLPNPGPTDKIQGDPGADPSLVASGSLVLIQGAENVTVRDLIITGGTGAGIWIVDSGLQEAVVVFNCELTNNWRRGLRLSRGIAFVIDTVASGNFSDDGPGNAPIGRGFEAGPYASLTCRGCISMDNHAPLGGLTTQQKEDINESALLVFGHSRALVRSIGENPERPSMLSGKNSADADENAFIEITESSVLYGPMVVSDKSHLEILDGSEQFNNVVTLPNAIRLDSLLEVSGAATMVDAMKVHDFSYVRSDGAMLGDVEVESFSNGIINGGMVEDIMCSSGSDIICPDPGAGPTVPMSSNCSCLGP